MTFPLSPGVYVTETDLTPQVQAISTSAAAIAGIYAWGPVNLPSLVSSEQQLVKEFGGPSNLNAETWFSGANFLGYGNSLWVSRAANTTANTANAAYNAVGNTGIVGNILNNVIRNQEEFPSQTFGDANVQFIARYPGAMGNSIRVSQCDSPNAYSSNVSFSGTIVGGTSSGNSYTGVLSVNIGSNTGTIVFSPTAGSNVAAGNTFATALMSQFTIGDNILLGNNFLGIANSNMLKLSGYSNAVTNSTATALTLNFAGRLRLPYNITATGVRRFWEFYNQVGVAPSTTPSVKAVNSNTAIVDQMSVVIVDQNGAFTGIPGQILETWNNVSFATDAVNRDGTPAYYQTVINNGSQYIWAVNDRTGLASANSVTITNSTNQNPLSLQFNLGQDGDSEFVAPLQTLATGWQLFTNKEYPISLVITGHPTGGTGSFNGQTFYNFQLVEWVLQNVALQRNPHDCVVFASPDKSTVVNNPGQEAVSIYGWSTFLNPSTYLVLDTGYKWQYDRYNNIYRWIPLNGDIAGLCAYTDQVSFPWYSPAGINRGLINNVTKLAYNPSEAERDFLYPLGINPVISEASYGTYLDGDRTFTTVATAFNRINVRRLFIYCEVAIALASKVVDFEINDVYTQNMFKNMINPFLKGIEGSRGITDFVVVCDATSNTPQVVDANQFLARIYIKPPRVIDFIRLDFVAVPTGTSFSEVESPRF